MKYSQTLVVLASVIAASAVTPSTVRSEQPQPLQWEHTAEIRLAFYEAPPRNVRVSMQKAIEQECRSNSRDESASVWLCRGDPVYLVRAVDVLGNRSTTGLVCEGEGNLKYYTPDMFDDEDSHCMTVCYDAKRKSHYIQH